MKAASNAAPTDKYGRSELHVEDTKQNAPDDFSSLLWRKINRYSLSTELVSPFGFGALMALVKLGSSGSTEKEVQQALKFQKEVPLGLYYERIFNTYHELKQQDVHVVFTGAILDSSNVAEFRPEFVKYAKEKFKVGLINTDYSRPDRAIREVNRRFTFASKDILAGILRPGDIITDSLQPTEMIILNGMYFQAMFERKSRFNAKHTRKGIFYNLNGTIGKVDMMSGNPKVMRAKLDNFKCKAIGIPYKGKKFTFVVVLPDNKEGLNDLHAQIDSIFFRDIWKKLKDTKPQATATKLPKFTAYARVDFRPILSSMGVKTMFRRAADFHGYFTPGWNRHVSDFFQLNLIDISEKGSVCSAVFDFRRPKPQNDHAEFLVDHPFLFFVMDEDHDTIMFVGCKYQF